jgi:hypothetical protein
VQRRVEVGVGRAGRQAEVGAEGATDRDLAGGVELQEAVADPTAVGVMVPCTFEDALLIALTRLAAVVNVPFAALALPAT